ncbi:kelch domain-containing protein 8A-like [Clavelina lepadiformis]|uniref:kelch domain-containing protein 8A-like n=1 Tax=Clavelina lepadiformis TaxID=159417 RepID=UPI0040436F40
MAVTNYKWSSIASMSVPRVYTSVTFCNGLLYVIGGCDEMGQPVNTLEAYDPTENSWTKLKGLPTKRAAPIVAALDGKIIAIGGVGPTQAPVDAVEVYYTAENKWKRLAPVSEPLMGMASFLKDNTIHIFGGMAMDSNPRDHFKCLVISSSGSEKWQAFPPMPTARYAAQAYCHNNKAVVVGGRMGKIPVDAFEVFDFDLRSWCRYPNIPSKRVFPCYGITDNYLLSLGGLRQNAQQGFCDACEVYPLEQNEKGEWQSHKRMAMPTKRGDFAVASIDNQVVVVGGLGNEGKPLSSTELFNPETKKWKRLTDMPRAHSTCSCVTHQGKLYVIGGVTPDGPTATCEIFQPESLPE